MLGAPGIPCNSLGSSYRRKEPVLTQQYASIFTRCPQCDKIILKSETHDSCNKIPTFNLLEELYKILLAENREMDQSELTRIINKIRGGQKYCQFNLTYEMSKHPDVFVESETRKYHWKLRCREEAA